MNTACKLVPPPANINIHEKQELFQYSLHAYVSLCFGERRVLGQRKCCFFSIQDGVYRFSLGEGNYTSTACDAPLQKQSKAFTFLVYRQTAVEAGGVDIKR